jgi:1-acyl-sn-glycerol-3-phosphate acyltransferase
MTLGFSLRTEGMQHVPRQGPALLIANHQSYLDPVLVGLAARRRLWYVARSTLFRHRFFGWYIRSLNAVPIDQEGTGIEGLRATLRLLKEGKPVMVFPEGGRTPHGKIEPLKPGIHLLMKRAPAPIIPLGIAGAYEAWPTRRPYPILAPLFLPASERTIAVSVGPALDARRYADLSRERALSELFDVLQQVHRRAEQLRRKQ